MANFTLMALAPGDSKPWTPESLNPDLREAFRDMWLSDLKIDAGHIVWALDLPGRPLQMNLELVEGTSGILYLSRPNPPKKHRTLVVVAVLLSGIRSSDDKALERAGELKHVDAGILFPPEWIAAAAEGPRPLVLILLRYPEAHNDPDLHHAVIGFADAFFDQFGAGYEETEPA